MNIPYKFAIGFQEGICPLSCNKCAAFSKNARKEKIVGKMNLDLAKRLIDEISEIGGNYIQPSIYTEPFANKDFKKIIDYCNKKNIGMSIITNGILINDDWIDFIINNMKENYTISFSLDAVTQQTYEKVRSVRVGKQYDIKKLEETIYELLRRKGKYPRIGVNFTIEKDNQEEADLFLEKWKGIVDAVRINTCIDHNKKIPEEYKKNITKYVPCNKCFDVMVIDFNGDVRVCQVDAFGDSYMGNVFEEGILNVWNGNKLEELRKRHIDNKFLESDFCYGCEAGKLVIEEEIETSTYLIKRGSHLTYYNKK